MAHIMIFGEGRDLVVTMDDQEKQRVRCADEHHQAIIEIVVEPSSDFLEISPNAPQDDSAAQDEIESVLVVAQPGVEGLQSGCWMIGVARRDEDMPLPPWNFQYTTPPPTSSSAIPSHALSLFVPDNAKIQSWAASPM